MRSKQVAIDVDTAVHIDAVEIDEDFPAADIWQRKGLAIPADTAIQKTATAPCGRLPIEWKLDAPIMRNIQRTPSSIIKNIPFGMICIPEKELPVPVKRNATSSCLPCCFRIANGKDSCRLW